MRSLRVARQGPSVALQPLAGQGFETRVAPSDQIVPGGSNCISSPKGRNVQSAIAALRQVRFHDRRTARGQSKAEGD